jgi:hypothetical protein
MDLKNPIIRKVFRAIIAALMDEEREAFRLLIKQFGLDFNKTIEVGKYIWSNRNKPPFNSIGYEEVPLKIIREIAENLKGKNSALTFNNFFSYFKGGLGITIPSRGILSQREVLPTLLLNKLNKEYENKSEILEGNFAEAYDAVNSAFKSKDYLELINNKEMQKRVFEGVPFKKSANAYDSIIRKQMRVLMRYVDSFEN